MKLFFVLAMALFLTGCGNAVEISDRDFVVMAGIDKLDSRTYKTTVGSAVFSGESSKGSVNIKSAEGESLPSALEMSDLSDALSPYYGQLKTVLLGEELIKDKEFLGESIEVLLKNNDINMKTILLGCEGKAASVVEATGKKENEYGLYIWDFYKNIGEATDMTYKMTVNDIAIKRDRGYILPMAKAEGDKIKIGGGIVMDGLEFKGIVEGEMMRACMLITEDIKGAVLDNEGEAAKIKSNRRKISFISEDKRNDCCIDIFIKVQPLTEEFDLLSAEKRIEQEAKKAIDTIYGEYKTDALGLYEQAYKNDTSYSAEEMGFVVNVFMAIE